MSKSFVPSEVTWRERYDMGYSLAQVGADQMLPDGAEGIETDVLYVMDAMRRGSTKMFECDYFKCWIRRIDKKGIDKIKLFVLIGRVKIDCPTLDMIFPSTHFTAIHSPGHFTRLVDTRGYEHDRMLRLYELFGALMTYKALYELFTRESWNVTLSHIIGLAKCSKEVAK